MIRRWVHVFLLGWVCCSGAWAAKGPADTISILIKRLMRAIEASHELEYIHNVDPRELDRSLARLGLEPDERLRVRLWLKSSLKVASRLRSLSSQLSDLRVLTSQGYSWLAPDWEMLRGLDPKLTDLESVEVFEALTTDLPNRPTNATVYGPTKELTSASDRLAETIYQGWPGFELAITSQAVIEQSRRIARVVAQSAKAGFVDSDALWSIRDRLVATCERVDSISLQTYEGARFYVKSVEVEGAATTLLVSVAEIKFAWNDLSRARRARHRRLTAMGNTLALAHRVLGVRAWFRAGSRALSVYGIVGDLEQLGPDPVARELVLNKLPAEGGKLVPLLRRMAQTQQALSASVSEYHTRYRSNTLAWLHLFELLRHGPERPRSTRFPEEQP